MLDPRISKLAEKLINYSVNLQKGEKILIEAFNTDAQIVTELVKAAYRAGGHPFVTIKDNSVLRALQMGGGREQFELMAKYDAYRMEDMDAYVGVRGADNSYENVDVPGELMQEFGKYYSTPVHHNIRVCKTKWVILRYPTPSFAQLCGMSTEAFEDYFFDVCTMDYARMDKAMDALKALMERTDRVRLVAPGTDLSFSIKGIPAIKCSGNMNIPDGEVYTAPVRGSVNGRITYNAPSIQSGFKFENVSLHFQDGKIVEATANDSERVNKIFDTDEGARYVGEFAIGVNPYVTKPVGDILFDEKISGSIHFTPGCCYDDADNGNHSSVHWDLVLIQTEAYGGGEIWFDDVLIRKDGLFVLPELEALNPENLK